MTSSAVAPKAFLRSRSSLECEQENPYEKALDDLYRDICIFVCDIRLGRHVMWQRPEKIVAAVLPPSKASTVPAVSEVG